jgi:hypothetical protein
MAAFIDIADQYLTDVAGCSTRTVATALRTAAQVFCERTRAWQVELDAMFLFPSISDYEFDLDPEQEIVKVLGATIDDVPVPLKLDNERHGRCIVVNGPFAFSVCPPPAARQTLVIAAALEPSNTASTIDDELFRKYGRIIAQGARAELFGMKGQPFSDPAASLAARASFMQDIDKTITAVGKQFSSAPQRVRPSFL